MFKSIQDEVLASIQTKEKILNSQIIINQIQTVSDKLIESYKSNGKLLIAGNGGSAADAQHIAGELVSRFYFDRKGLPAIALTTDTSILTAIGNDYGYEKLFARQIQAHAQPQDIFIGISTSGNSENIIQAILEAKKIGVFTVALTGETGGKLNNLADLTIKVPSKITPRIQESHILIGHIICAIVEKEIFDEV